MITEHSIRTLQGADFEYEEPDPELPRWAFASFWTGALIACVGILYLAGQCLSMAWEAWPL